MTDDVQLIIKEKRKNQQYVVLKGFGRVLVVLKFGISQASCVLFCHSF